MTEAEKEHLVSKARDAYTALRKKYKRHYRSGLLSHIAYSAKLDRLENAFYEREQTIVDEFKRKDIDPLFRFVLPKLATPLPPGTYNITPTDVKTEGKVMTITFDF